MSQKYKVEIYNFVDRKFDVMTFAQCYLGKKNADNLSKDEAEFVRDMALSISTGIIDVRISKDKK